MTPEEIRQLAIDDHYHEGVLEIDSDAAISQSPHHGAYVAAWVWIDAPEAEDCPYATGKEDCTCELPDVPHVLPRPLLRALGELLTAVNDEDGGNDEVRDAALSVLGAAQLGTVNRKETAWPGC